MPKQNGDVIARIASELVDMARAELSVEEHLQNPFLGERKPATRKLGEALHRHGGMPAMQEAAEIFIASMRLEFGFVRFTTDLELAWHGVGHWIA